MRRLAAVLIALVAPSAMPQQTSSSDVLVGVHISRTSIANPGRNILVKAGDSILNELIVYPDPETPGALRGYASSMSTNGEGCQVRGPVSEASAGSFKISETLYGATCTISVRRDGNALRIEGQSSSCWGFCGSGSGGFARTPYRRLCGVIAPGLPKLLSDRLIAREATYGPDCPERR